jgi:CheY-like chemotaxis protein/HPt (histidine-containing phosphotransfer) domain-containing protein
VGVVFAEKAVTWDLRFEVSDTGIGISPENIDRLFQPFVQADPSMSRKYGGSGLGLTITKRIVEKMGGQVQVKSTPGQGSTFTMIVPAGPMDGIAWVQHPAQEVTGSAETPRAAGTLRLLAGLRILLAEDGPDNQLLIRTVLSKAGAEVEVVENGRLAVRAAKHRRFDLILMDIQMPEMDGYEATGELRAQGCTLPIVALTAHALSWDRDRCIAAGCTDYMAKPIDRAAMIDLILKHTSRRQTPVEQSGAPAEEPPPPVVDAIGSQFADDKDMAEVIASFVQQLPQRCQAMREALNHNDFPSLGRLAHQLKGAGGSYGYACLTDAARELESYAKGEDAEAAMLALNRLSHMCERVQAGYAMDSASQDVRKT